MVGWSVETWTVIIGAISLLAFFRPEWSAVYRRLRSNVELHPTSILEFSFAEFGPQIGLQGTLRALHNDHFVSNMKIQVSRKGDNVDIEMPWHIFRSPEIVIDFASRKQQQLGVSNATPFILPQDSPRSISIIFADNTKVIELQELAKEVRNKWNNFISHPATQQKIQNASKEADKPLNASDLFNEFSEILSDHQDTCLINLYSNLQKIVYWEPGLYDAYVYINTSRPTRDPVYQITFEVTTEQANRIQQNAHLIIMMLCQISVECNHEQSRIKELHKWSSRYVKNKR